MNISKVNIKTSTHLSKMAAITIDSLFSKEQIKSTFEKLPIIEGKDPKKFRSLLGHVVSRMGFSKKGAMSWNILPSADGKYEVKWTGEGAVASTSKPAKKRAPAPSAAKMFGSATSAAYHAK